MSVNNCYDIAGIGIGPFNLGLAALTHGTCLTSIFIDQQPAFNWHPGLLLPNAKMQVPFYADLVTLADPTSPFSYLNYLKETGKLFHFAINESYFPYRSEYNNYCKWVVAQLDNLLFGWRCSSIVFNERQKDYTILIDAVNGRESKCISAKNIVIGIGSSPKMPACAKNIDHPAIFHSAEYLLKKTTALMHKKITIIGSGQSAAEIFLDLLPHLNNLEQLHWITRSDRFYPMDYSKLTLQMSTPDYIQYFYSLSREMKKSVLKSQQYLYKGINFDLINEIYEQLYYQSFDSNNRMPVIRTNCALEKITIPDKGNINLQFHHQQKEEKITLVTNAVILSTGYENTTPDFLNQLTEQINYDEEGNFAVNENYSIDKNNSIFVQNAEQHTHGFNSADLGLGPHRNAQIINLVNGKMLFATDAHSTFQTF